MVATLSGHADVVRFLISKRADLNIIDRSGCTALHHAAATGSHELCKILVLANCDFTKKNKRGETAAQLAKSMGDDEIATYLANARMQSPRLPPSSPTSPRIQSKSPRVDYSLSPRSKGDMSPISATKTISEDQSQLNNTVSKTKSSPFRVFSKRALRPAARDSAPGNLPSYQEILELNMGTQPAPVSKQNSSVSIAVGKSIEIPSKPSNSRAGLQKESSQSSSSPKFIRNNNWTIKTAEDGELQPSASARMRTGRAVTSTDALNDGIIAKAAIGSETPARSSFVKRPRRESIAEFLQSEVNSSIFGKSPSKDSDKGDPNKSQVEPIKSFNVALPANRPSSPRLAKAVEIHPSSRFRSLDLSHIKETAPMSFMDQFPPIANIYPFLKEYACGMKDDIGVGNMRAFLSGKMWICKYYLCFVGGTERKREIVYLPDIQSITLQGKNVVIMRDELESTIENVFSNFLDPAEDVLVDIQSFWKAAMEDIKNESEVITERSRAAVRRLATMPALNTGVHSSTIISPKAETQMKRPIGGNGEETNSVVISSGALKSGDVPKVAEVSNKGETKESLKDPNGKVVESISKPRRGSAGSKASAHAETAGPRTKIKRDKSTRATVALTSNDVNRVKTGGSEPPKEKSSSSHHSSKKKKSHSSSKERAAETDTEKRKSSHRHRKSHKAKDGGDTSTSKPEKSHKHRSHNGGEPKASISSKHRHSSRKSSHKSHSKKRENVQLPSSQVEIAPSEVKPPESIPKPNASLETGVPNASSKNTVPTANNGEKEVDLENSEEREVRLAREAQKARFAAANTEAFPSPAPPSTNAVASSSTAATLPAKAEDHDRALLGQAVPEEVVQVGAGVESPRDPKPLATLSPIASNSRSPKVSPRIPLSVEPPTVASDVLTPDQIAMSFLRTTLRPPFETWMALLTDDFKYSIQNGPGLDKKHLMSLFKSVFLAFPDFAYSIISLTQDGESNVVVKMRGVCTHTGTYALPGMPKLEATGKKITLDVETAYVTITGGKVKSWRTELSSYMAGITGLFTAAGGRLGLK